MSRRDRYDPSEYAQRKAMQRDRAERIRASRSQQGGGGGGGGGSGSSGAGGGGGSSGGWAEPDARGDSRGDDLLSRLEALKSQLSTPQHADARPAPDEEPGRARSDAERARRREAEAALQRERHKHITMQDEIAGLREQVTALQNTSRPPSRPSRSERWTRLWSAPTACRRSGSRGSKSGRPPRRRRGWREKRRTRPGPTCAFAPCPPPAGMLLTAAAPAPQVRFLVERDAKAQSKPPPAPAPRNRYRRPTRSSSRTITPLRHP